jgi:hypothetical protein
MPIEPVAAQDQNRCQVETGLNKCDRHDTRQALDIALRCASDVAMSEQSLLKRVAQNAPEMAEGATHLLSGADPFVMRCGGLGLA